jgi:polar amino acid transport system substrate-binding protein
MNRRVIILLLLLVNFLYASVTLTPKEKEFLNNHPTIVLGTGDSWAPYAFLNEDGSVIGYDIDILRKINEATGANFVLRLGDWSKMQEMAKAKKIDGLSEIGVFQERKEWFNFSNIYISVKKMLMVKSGNPLNIKSLDDLSGKTIVIHKGNMPDEKIAKELKNSKIIYAPTVEDALKEVIFGKGDALFGNGATKYLSSTLGIPYIEPIFPLDNSLELAFAIRKDWPEAISILDKGLATIPTFERMQLMEKWFTSGNTNSTKFSEAEYNYLNKKQEITICLDPNWMPFEELEQGKHIGITSDYFKIFQEQLGIPNRVIPTRNWEQTIEYAKQRRCDIISLSATTADRKKYMNFTVPYISAAIVLATKPNIPFISNLRQLGKEKIGIVKGYAFKERLLQLYPKLQIVEVENISEGLQKVVEGELFGLVDTLPTIAYMFQKEFMNRLQISGKFIDQMEFSIAVRNDDAILLNIFNKLLQNISLNTKQDISNKYINIQY